MTIKKRIQHPARISGSTTISTASEQHTWSSNYRLLRKLFPKWDPNDEELREVWFRCFDKENGLGPDLVAHDLLKEAIVEARKVHSWNEPNLELVSRFYRIKRTERLMEQEKMMRRDEQAVQSEYVAKEHQRRIDRIASWSEPRRAAAVSLAVGRFQMLARHKQKPISEWSPMMTGLVVAADEEILLAQ